jgi:hypothetical protein
MTAALTPPTGAELTGTAPAERPSGLIGTMKVNGNSRYDDGERTYQRTSTMLKQIETDTFNLDEWRANTLAVGLSSRSDLILGVTAAAQYDPITGKLTQQAKSTLRDLRRQAMDAGRAKAGATQGTAIHTATERLDLGESVEQIGLPYPFDADLRAYETLCKAMGLRYRPEHIERSVRNDKTGTVGSYDRLGESGLLVERGILAPGELLVVDVKTEEDPLRNLIHIAPQLANYANADEQWVPQPRPWTQEDPKGPFAGRYEAMPPVSTLVGLVIHVRAGRATPYLINLAVGWEAAQAAARQRDRIAESKIKLGDDGCWALALPIDLPPAAALVQDRAAPELEAARERVESVTVQQSVRDASGNVTWHAVPAEPIPAGSMPLEAMLWEAIQVADSIGELSELFERASATGVAWEGPIAESGIARGRVVGCPQREMHDPSTTAKCACGWARGMAP